MGQVVVQYCLILATKIRIVVALWSEVIHSIIVTVMSSCKIYHTQSSTWECPAITSHFCLFFAFKTIVSIPGNLPLTFFDVPIDPLSDT